MFLCFISEVTIFKVWCTLNSCYAWWRHVTLTFTISQYSCAFPNKTAMLCHLHLSHLYPVCPWISRSRILAPFPDTNVTRLEEQSNLDSRNPQRILHQSFFTYHKDKTCQRLENSTELGFNSTGLVIIKHLQWMKQNTSFTSIELENILWFSIQGLGEHKLFTEKCINKSQEK